MSNPYLAPEADPNVQRPGPHSRGLQLSLIVLLLTVVAGLAAETYHHETIVFAGPFLFLSGLAVFRCGVRDGNRWAATVGGSAAGLCLLIVLLINLNGWGPADGDAPITFLIWAWTSVAGPAGAGVLVGSFGQVQTGNGQRDWPQNSYAEDAEERSWQLPQPAEQQARFTSGSSRDETG